MRWDEIPPGVAKLAVEAKALARRNNSKRNVALFVGFLLGMGIALFWNLYSPIAYLSPKMNLLFGIMIGAFVALLIIVLQEKCDTSEEAVCPVCCHSWKIKEGKGVPIAEQLESWDRCPGCGLLMSDALLNVTLKRHASVGNSPLYS